MFWFSFCILVTLWLCMHVTCMFFHQHLPLTHLTHHLRISSWYSEGWCSSHCSWLCNANGKKKAYDMFYYVMLHFMQCSNPPMPLLTLPLLLSVYLSPRPKHHSVHLMHQYCKSQQEGWFWGGGGGDAFDNNKLIDQRFNGEGGDGDGIGNMPKNISDW